LRTIDTVYIDGQFVTPHGEELFRPVSTPPPRRESARCASVTPSTPRPPSPPRSVRFRPYSRTSKAERIALLRRLHDARRGAD